MWGLFFLMVFSTGFWKPDPCVVFHGSCLEDSPIFYWIEAGFMLILGLLALFSIYGPEDMINKVDKNFDRFDPILDRLFIIFVGLVCIFGFYIIFETFGPEDMVNELKSYITSIQKELGLE